MKTWLLNNKIAVLLTAIVIVATDVIIGRIHIPGHVDVIAAQAMDMSQMRPPTGSAVVSLGEVRRGNISDTVTYTATIRAYNEQDISPRITGMVLSLPVYPGDKVKPGELVAQLDTSQVEPQAEQAEASAQSAEDAADVAHLTHHLHHKAALEQATANQQAAQSALADSFAAESSAKAEIADADAALQSSQANATYWAAEIAREKKLADAGAVSQEEYQNELAQSQAAQSAVTQALAKCSSAKASYSSSTAKADQARAQLTASKADVKMAQADITIAQGQAQQATADAQSAEAAAQVAQANASYAHIVSQVGGVVIARPVAPGTLVQPGTTLLKIAEIDQVRIQAQVAITDLTGISPGTVVVITPQDANGGKPFLAHVTSVFPSADDQTRTAIVEAVVPNPSHKLVPGGFAVMKIARASHSDSLMVPASSIISQNGQSYVWIAQASTNADTIYECVICHIHYSAKQAAQFNYKDPMDGGQLVPIASSKRSGHKAMQIPVDVGASNGEWTQITSGSLTPNELVVTAGQAGLADGDSLVTSK